MIGKKLLVGGRATIDLYTGHLAENEGDLEHVIVYLGQNGVEFKLKYEEYFDGSIRPNYCYELSYEIPKNGPVNIAVGDNNFVVYEATNTYLSFQRIRSS